MPRRRSRKIHSWIVVHEPEIVIAAGPAESRYVVYNQKVHPVEQRIESALTDFGGEIRNGRVVGREQPKGFVGDIRSHASF